ncbi:hypothetical protein [Bradyrhizobium sp.]|uniref:hypothetical protein n=1 Tax=Bradyrhizobium sp. TaxID=376 RepID=UPI002387275F|nr:hypothetical protein [Bradyrhizobium sp.]MDE1933518.1 hypothetical protein [Bradyrhizobium sp.]
MAEPASFPFSPSYEQACDRLIAMCNGDPRSTIKALILANEYLETELSELRTKAVNLGATARRSRHRDDAA